MLTTGVALPKASMDWPTEIAPMSTMVAGTVPPFTTLVFGADRHLHVAAREVHAVVDRLRTRSAAHGEHVAAARDHFARSRCRRPRRARWCRRTRSWRRTRASAVVRVPKRRGGRARARGGQRGEAGAAGVAGAVDLEGGVRVGVHRHLAELLDCAC